MATAKLPVLATVGKAYRAVFSHTAELWLIARSWAVAAGVALALSAVLMNFAPEDAVRHSQGIEPIPVGAKVAAMTGLSALILSFGVFAIVVRWHRMVIRDLTPADNKRRAMSRGFLYLARSLLLAWGGMAFAMIMGLLPITLSRDLPLTAEQRPFLAGAFILAAIILSMLGIWRFSLILPGGAVEDHAMTLRKSWEATRGNSWRMLGGTMLSAGPAVLANMAFNGSLEYLPKTSANFFVLTLNIALSLALVVFTAVIQASFLSYAYLFFVGGSASTADDHIVHAPPALER